MLEYHQLSSKIFNFSPSEFDDIALQIFEYQYNHNPIYKQFVNYLNKRQDVKDIYSIPYLPVELFKNHTILSDEFQAIKYFESSGTTGSISSKHYYQDLKIYEQSYLNGFQNQYGSPSDWVILGLLPSYLERKNASLVNMVDSLMIHSGHSENGFYLYNYEKLKETLEFLANNERKVMLFGVTFALIEFARDFPSTYPNLTIIETGGMKGRGKELTRDELHVFLKQQLSPKQIHSEYGMSEMFSQAYSTDKGIFQSASTLKVLKRNPFDPFDIQDASGRGNINVIDLSNLHSCSFLATMDLGEFYDDGKFSVLGRSDYSDVRGCNLMYS